VLVSSGGLGSDVGLPLRAASLPGSEIVLRAATAPRVVRTLAWAGRALARHGKQADALSPRAVGKLEELSAPTGSGSRP